MKTVLVVDDVPEVTTLLKAQLERTGRFTVTVANNANDAVILAAAMKPDLVVSDVDMPGLDGGGFASELAMDESTRNIPVVFLSSLVTPRDERRTGRRPMISKSSPVAVLIAAIDSALS